MNTGTEKSRSDLLLPSREAEPQPNLPRLTTRDEETTACGTTLPRQDGGYAWIFLAAAFFCEALAFGYAFSVGILHDYWVTELFPESKDATVLAFAASLQAGLLPCLMPIASFMYNRFPRYRIVMQILGVITCGCGIISSAFAKEAWQLVLSLGCAYGLGGAFFYQPATAYLFDWFDRRRGMAGGIMYSASGLGGTVFPFLTQALLKKYGYRTTLISMGIGYTIVGCAASILVRPRGTSHHHAHTSGISARSRLFRVLRTHAFWAICLSVLSFALGMIVPTVYLPVFATDIGLSSEMGTVLVAVLNASSAAGMVIMGLLCDLQPLYLLVGLCTIPAALASWLLWGFSEHLAVTCVFSILFGFFGVGYLALAPKMVTVLAGEDVEVSSYLIAVIFFLTGLGNIISGPIATALQDYTWSGAKYAYGVTGFGPLIVYTGAVMLASAVLGMSILPL